MYFQKNSKMTIFNDHQKNHKNKEKKRKIKYTVKLKIISGCLQCIVHIRKVTEYNSIIL